MSVTRKLNLGNYESVDIFVAISGLRVGATTEEIEECLQTGEDAYRLIAREVVARTEEIRAAGEGR